MRKKTRVQRGMGKRAEQKEKQRQNLLDVSLDLFVHRGYHGTTVRDIAEQAHTSVGLLFHYFPTKQAILEELATFARVGTSSARDLLAAPFPPLYIFEQIVEMSFHYLEEPAASRLFLLVNQINTLESIPEHIKQIVSSTEVVRASLPLILKGQHMGEIKQGDPLSLALAFWGAIQGIAEVRLWFPDAPVPDSQCIVDLLKVSRQ
jgi:AcrR family transcriptional regulator